MIWSSFLTASRLGPVGAITPLPSSLSSYAGISAGGLGVFIEPCSLELLVLVGFVLGDDAGEAVTGDGLGC